MYLLHSAYLLRLLCLILGSCLTLHAQNVRVTGTVTSASDNSALVGISVLVKGTNNGTTSNATGEYAINAPSGGTLVFSFVGFEKQ